MNLSGCGEEKRSFVNGFETECRGNKVSRRTARVANCQCPQGLGGVERETTRGIVPIPARLAAKTPRRPLGRCFLAQGVWRPQRDADAASDFLGGNVASRGAFDG